MNSIFLHCRAGFESECAREFAARAASAGVSGRCDAGPGSARVLFHPSAPGGAERLLRHLDFHTLVFARQWFLCLARRDRLPAGGRTGPILEVLSLLDGPAAEVFVESPDGETTRVLSGLCRSFLPPLRRALRGAGRLDPAGSFRLHVCFDSTDAAWIGFSDPDNSAPWRMGIPRLRHHREAPSRAALKLEEAILRFLAPAARAASLREGLAAVDLGAAPGGWTWYLARQGLDVTAIDNGPLAPALRAGGLVHHLRADGLSYRPARPVEWMVCDMAEQPARVADLVARWMRNRWCRRCIFNLKLPMKRRFEEVERCLARIRTTLDAAHTSCHMSCKQLYHDREEITGYLVRVEAPRRPRPPRGAGARRR